MLPKSRRLTTEDFKTFKNGQVFHTPHFFVRIMAIPAGALPSSPEGKGAVIVSSSSYKKAVDRNFLRRRIYSIIRKHSLLLGQVVFTVTMKKGSLQASFRELEQELCSVFQKVPKRG